MSLKIMVVGRGTALGERVANGHSLEFVASARADSGIIPLEDCDFVFQHLSPANPEAADAVTEWINKGWKKRIVGFSGGKVPRELRRLDVPQLERLSGRQSILDLAWSAVPSDFSGDAHELLKLLNPRQIEILAALAILSQGYLAVHAACQNLGQPDRLSEDVAVALERMGMNALVAGGKGIASLLPPELREEKNKVQRVSWWVEMFGVLDEGERVAPGKWKEFENSLREEWDEASKGALPDPLRGLLDAMRSAPEIAEPDVVARAYCEIVRRLDGR
ncbi:MAG TPA: hypothetical protein VF538_16990 [Pyrinomonadaceae bacterium]|jgi:hypothetical protein